MNLKTSERALIFAAWKALETLAKSPNGPCHLFPGQSIDVSGQSVTITFPDGWEVGRDEGDDGIVEKTATSNAYGLAVIALMLERLERFNQNGVVLDAIIDAIEIALKRETPTADALRKSSHPQFEALEAAIAEVQARLPKRREPTARRLTKGDRPTITVDKKAKAA